MSQAAEFTCSTAGASGVTCLKAAINTANGNGEANTITLVAGTYPLTTVDNNTDGPNGLPSITSTLTITGAGTDITIIERQSSALPFRLLHVVAGGRLSLNGLTLQGGFLGVNLSPNPIESAGGGIVNFGTLTLTHCSLTNNVVDYDGSGIFNNGGATLTLTNSTIAHNTAYGSDGGGGIFNFYSPYASPSSTTLQNTILALNTAPNASPPSDDCVGVLTSLGTNLIGDASGCTITRPQGGNDLTGDPGLDAFTTGDGAPGRGHFPLQESSQAIDPGNDDICPETDQLRQPRIGQCDIGAIEF